MLGAEDSDLAAGGAGGLVEGDAFGYGGGFGAPVEDDEHPGAEIEPIEVGVELGQPFLYRVGLAFAPDFELDRFALPLAFSVRSGPRPADEQVDAASADTV